MSYLGTKPSNQTPSYKQVYEYTATSGQTTFTAPYTPGFVEVYRNGVKLGSTDFTATDGATVVLGSGATAGDFVQVVSLFIGSTMGAIPNTTGAVATTNIADGNVTQSKLAAGVAGNGPAFNAYLSASQTISNTWTWNKILFDIERFDTNNSFSSNRFQPSVAGYYQVNFGITVSSSVPCSSSIFKNGSGWIEGTPTYTSGAFNGKSVVSDIIYLNGSTDYIEFYALASAQPATVYAGSTSSYASASLVRAA